MALTLPTATRSDMANALNDRFTTGSTIEIRTGTRPAVNTAATGTVLATVALNDPAFEEAAGVLTLDIPVSAVTAVADGTASWFRALDGADGTILDGSVSETGLGGDLTLATTDITTGLSISITSGVITMPDGS